MSERQTTTNARGEVTSSGYSADLSDSELEARKRRARQSTTAGAGLGEIAKRLKKEGPMSGNRTPEYTTLEIKNMDPLSRANYERTLRERKKKTAADAAAALGNR